MRTRWVISCEHGGNDLPAGYVPLFAGAEKVLMSHRGWDPGALPLFKALEPLADFSLSGSLSRLLIELNRSLDHPDLFSEYTRGLSQSAKEAVIQQYYLPYRQAVENAIGSFLQQEQKVVHLSIHSFTPVLNGVVREADLGLLFDPDRAFEASVCEEWLDILQRQFPQFSIRYNYPYLGIDDGFTTYLRGKFPERYAGIELELNQKWADDLSIRKQLVTTVEELQRRLRR